MVTVTVDQHWAGIGQGGGVRGELEEGGRRCGVRARDG